MKIIFGNNEGEKTGINSRAEKLGFEKITETKEFEYQGKKFFICHGYINQILDNAIKSQKYDYILSGHTHKKRDEKVGKTRIINPGSLFGEENTIATLEVKTDKLEFIKI